MNQPNVLTWSILLKALSYTLRGKLRVRRRYLPLQNQQIPEDFIGVGVASAPDPPMDNYVIQQLNQLSIKQVRLDFTYGDLTSFNARFLDRLLKEGFAVSLHLIQPFENARRMQFTDEQQQWRHFLAEVLQRFGKQVLQVEIGNTINRKRWSGYHLPGFLIAWGIAYQEIKKEQITLAGPNISDFEPFYNIGILSLLKSRSQLPDIHTNNLFSERVAEPEQFDHRILKFSWLTKLIKVNLIAKARILKKISNDFGIKRLISPVAFWAIYRIFRTLPDAKQKQADYAARYLLLCAASGSLRQVFWGALICHREGLIDDGLSDDQYPALERVAHYASVDGNLNEFQLNPSFHAIKTVANFIQGSEYIGPLTTAHRLKIHHFCSPTLDIHVAWTINGKVALLNELYRKEDLARAEIIDRDGVKLEGAALITESPIYLCWPRGGIAPNSVNKPILAKDLSIHVHIEGLHYFPIQEAGWFGMILAKNAHEAALLWQMLQPANLQRPDKSAALRHARNAIWPLPDPRDPNRQVTVKQPVKMYPHKAFLDRFKPSKAMRSWNGAVELLRRGIDTAHPVAFFEKTGDLTLKQNFYICDYVDADCSVGEMFGCFAQGNTEFISKNGKRISAEKTYSQIAYYVMNMHKRGVFFRDLSGGNVLVKILPNETLHFSLIDTARARFYNMQTPMGERLSDMVRICHKLHWAGRTRLMRLYLGSGKRSFSFKYRLPFYLYDAKVWLKRRIGRKGIKKMIHWFKQKSKA
ncbi:MAG: hypothetical protein CTY33_10630 [Methylotenera sp.]|nr:MAG: hypothetical protein CTY33_10630 [Methylotenera sp.]